MTHWGEKWGGKTLKKFTEESTYLLENDRSYAMYMVHGGTNFGLTAGANGSPTVDLHGIDYQPMITSYDYDAPINEQGRATEKYHKYRELMETIRK